ncbi:MAG: hypothetical protein K2N60_09710 [Oscillospiraceae bacterium]|nr:hypothetical protein [Oscillospiraceae bacterium]
MNKKILAAIFSMVLLCSCGNGNAEEQSETALESVTSAAETTSEMVSEETTNVSEASAVEEKVPITRDFFNDDVVFEEVILPVKITHYFTVNNVLSNEYDAAGNIICENTHTTYEYDYNHDGTYNGVLTYAGGKLREIKRYDKGGRCIEDTFVTDTSESANSYEYEFDGEGRLIRKSEIFDGEKESFEYTYDKEGRLYEELYNAAYYGYSRLRHEYDEDIENIYYFRDGLEEEILWKILEKDENGNTVKETIDIGSVDNSDYINGKLFTEYKYDSLNRLIYENHTVSDDYLYNDSNKANVYSYTYEYDGDNLKKKTTRNIHKDGTSEYWSNTETYEYFYDENGRIIKEVYIYDSEYDPNDEYPNGYTTEYFYNDGGSIISRTYHTNGTLLNETEYAMIPKIVTGIEYKNYNEVNP